MKKKKEKKLRTSKTLDKMGGDKKCKNGMQIHDTQGTVKVSRKAKIGSLKCRT